ncbi:hypothetical protein ACF1CG_37200 [Streptomyces sp. NPDC014773]|uniref:hypothetical protein n=1 Tax=Streptomyces sp. NPDC014773 TaxID=3364908 RepID=UPI0036FB648E
MTPGRHPASVPARVAASGDLTAAACAPSTVFRDAPPWGRASTPNGTPPRPP